MVRSACLDGVVVDPDQALNVLIFIDAWQWTPMVALIVLAGLTSIPAETKEAAVMDGAGMWQKHWYVILPLAVFGVPSPRC